MSLYEILNTINDNILHKPFAIVMAPDDFKPVLLMSNSFNSVLTDNTTTISSSVLLEIPPHGKSSSLRDEVLCKALTSSILLP